MDMLQAYRQSQQDYVDPRTAEHAVFRKVTELLLAAAKLAARTDQYHYAVQMNRQLWMAVIRDVSDPTNSLPDDMKQRLLSIGLWVQRESAAATTGEVDLAGMIEVNEAIMGGLAAAV